MGRQPRPPLSAWDVVNNPSQTRALHVSFYVWLTGEYSPCTGLDPSIGHATGTPAASVVAGTQ
jgi:hypothetical protein